MAHPNLLQTPIQFESPPLPSKKPPLAALFLIVFDVKVGYTIAWKRSIPDVSVEGTVEFKALPSGLHDVDEDIVYFTHEDYAGISAFRKGQSSKKQDRNAVYAAAVALVKRQDGRLGKAWEHASALRQLAGQSIKDQENVLHLAAYWDDFGSPIGPDHPNSPQLSPFTIAQRKTRTQSAISITTSERNTLATYHPALSILRYIDTFGPLIFPLHRAALLRKRILFVDSAPIRRACEFSFVLSILSSLAPAVASSLSFSSESLIRLRPLFAIGLHDIPLLQTLAKTTIHESPLSEPNDDHPLPPAGWIACTTDKIITDKTALYDLVVELHTTPGRPRIRTSESQRPIRATQRDWRRYKALRRTLLPLCPPNRFPSRTASQSCSFDNLTRDPDDTISLLQVLQSPTLEDPDYWQEDDCDEADYVEPKSWSQLIYNAFMWWASAGAQDTTSKDNESAADANLLKPLADLVNEKAEATRYRDEDPDTRPDHSVETSEAHETNLSSKSSFNVTSVEINPSDDISFQDTTQSSHATSQRVDASVEAEVIDYFHHLTSAMFEACTAAITDEESQLDDSIPSDLDHSPPRVDSESIRLMGLDSWSSSDKSFVKDFAGLYFAREVLTGDSYFNWCGLRIC